MKIGVQVYSVRDAAEKDFIGTMREIKKMGYDGVELAGTYGLSAEEVRRDLAEVGLTAISAHVPMVICTANRKRPRSASQAFSFNAAFTRTARLRHRSASRRSPSRSASLAPAPSAPK